MVKIKFKRVLNNNKNNNTTNKKTKPTKVIERIMACHYTTLDYHFLCVLT